MASSFAASAATMAAMSDVEMVEAFAAEVRERSLRGALTDEERDDIVWMLATRYGWTFGRAKAAYDEWDAARR